MAAIVATAPWMMLVVDSERRVRFLNRAAIRAAGTAEDAPLGRLGGEVLRCVHHLDHPDGCGFGPRCQACPLRRSILETLAEGTARELPAVSLPSMDEPERHLSAQATPLRFQNQLMVLLCLQDVTDRVEAATALEGERRRARQLLDITPSIILGLDREGRIALLNERGARMLGCPQERAIGEDWIEVFIPPRARSEVRSVFRRIVAGEVQELATYENEIVALDGRERVIRWQNAVLHDDRGRVTGTLSSGEDITERRRSEEALRASEERLRILSAVVEQSANPVAIVDRRGTVQYLNPAALSLSRIPGESLVGKPWSNVVFTHSTLPEDMAPIRDAIREGQHWRGEVSDVDADGRTVWRDVLVFPIKDAAQRTTHVVYSSTEITARKKAEEARLQLEAQVQRAQKLESLGVLAGGIAHDFNNLLVSVLGNANLASLSLPNDSPARTHVGDIETAARRASDLCGQLLAYAGQGSFLIATVDLNQVVEEMASLLRVSVSKKAELRLRLAADPVWIRADATQLRQVLLNLVVNASEALAERTGTTTVSTGTTEADPAQAGGAPIDVDWPKGRYAYLEVSDTGVGMDAKTRSRLFDPFFTTKTTGRGLGLSAVLGIVRAHRGTITVDSVPGGGTSFRVLIPVVENREVGETATAPPLAAGSWPVKGAVLVVDDEATVLEVSRQMLERLGFTPLVAADGRAGLEVFAAHADEICAVLLDLTMPQLGGDEVLRAIRARRADVPVVLMSGYTEQSIDKQAVATFLHKPFDTTELAAALRRAFEPPSAIRSVAARRILLVDDDAQVRAVGRAVLERLGHTVVEAASGRQAVEECTRAGSAIDLVILDQLMPVMDGADTFLALRERAPQLPVLFASGSVQPDAQRTMVSHGVAGFVRKPYTVEEMELAIWKALNRR